MRRIIGMEGRTFRNCDNVMTRNLPLVMKEKVYVQCNLPVLIYCCTWGEEGGLGLTRIFLLGLSEAFLGLLAAIGGGGGAKRDRGEYC